MKKVISVLAISVFLGAATVFAAGSVFSDVPDGQWYSNAINNLQNLGIVAGYEDGSFKPHEDISRAEIAVIIDRTIDYVEMKYKNKGLITAETAHIIANANPECLELAPVPFEHATYYLKLQNDKFYWDWSGADYFCKIDAETGEVVESYFMEL